MQNAKCKILIIGLKGMLGQALFQEFSVAGYEILGWDKGEIDITKRDEVNKKIFDLKPGIIINAAAYNAVDKIEEEDEVLALAVNGYAVGNLSEAAEAVGAVLVHYSTDYVFDGECTSGHVRDHKYANSDANRCELGCDWGYKEDDMPNPQSVYARSKWLGEQALLNPNFQFSIFNFQKNTKYEIPKTRYYLIRTSRLFGRAALGDGAKKSFVDVMLKLADEKDCLEVVDEEVSSPTYVQDLARRTREIIEWQKSFGIYHVTNSGACTWYGWAKKIFELSGKNVKLIPVRADKFPRPAKRPKYSVLLNTKLPPMRKWEEALEEYLRIK